jgi:mono/diheme cytochrome c family protein
MKKLFLMLFVGGILVACGPDKAKQPSDESEDNYENIHGDEAGSGATAKTDDGKGVGEVKEVTLSNPLEQERLGRGKAIYEMKCQACHRLDDQRVVGPGWKDVTKRRKPEWIMNMITNVDVMLAQDTEAQKLLELCLTRMPNQNVSVGDARDVLEFMRQNDGEK